MLSQPLEFYDRWQPFAINSLLSRTVFRLSDYLQTRLAFPASFVSADRFADYSLVIKTQPHKKTCYKAAVQHPEGWRSVTIKIWMCINRCNAKLTRAFPPPNQIGLTVV